MPETDGVHMSKDIDARHVMFISGYDQEALVAGNALFLQKPFSCEALTRAVRALFNEERTAVRTLA